MNVVSFNTVIQKFGFINGVDNVNWPRTEILRF